MDIESITEADWPCLEACAGTCGHFTDADDGLCSHCREVAEKLAAELEMELARESVTEQGYAVGEAGMFPAYEEPKEEPILL